MTHSGSRRSCARRLNLCFLALAASRACVWLRQGALLTRMWMHIARAQPRHLACTWRLNLAPAPAPALAALHGVNAQRVWHAALAESANAASLFRNAEEIKLFAISSPLLTPSCTFPAGTLP